jgi:antitoxin HicB
MVQSPCLQLKQPRPQTLGSCLLKAIKSDPELSQDMMMFNYPVNLEADDNGTILAWFPDLTGATFGEDEAEALANAVDLLETVLLGLIADRHAFPAPSPANERMTVSPSLLGALELSVYQAMRNRGWRKADLARAMGLNPRQIDRLLDLRHASTVAQLEQSLAACGARFEVGVCQLDPAGWKPASDTKSQE